MRRYDHPGNMNDKQPKEKHESEQCCSQNPQTPGQNREGCGNECRADEVSPEQARWNPGRDQGSYELAIYQMLRAENEQRKGEQVLPEESRRRATRQSITVQPFRPGAFQDALRLGGFSLSLHDSTRTRW